CFSIALKRHCPSRTPLEPKTPESNKSVLSLLLACSGNPRNGYGFARFPVVRSPERLLAMAIVPAALLRRGWPSFLAQHLRSVDGVQPTIEDAERHPALHGALVHASRDDHNQVQGWHDDDALPAEAYRRRPAQVLLVDKRASEPPLIAVVSTRPKVF